MSNLPSVWNGYIQVEEQQFSAAVSEYTGQRLGSNINYLYDNATSLQTQINNNENASNKVLLLGPFNYNYTGAGSSFPNITTFTARGTPIFLYAISGTFTCDAGTNGQFGFRRNGTNLANGTATDLSVAYVQAAPFSVSSAVGNAHTHPYPQLIDFFQPASGTPMTYDFILGNATGGALSHITSFYLKLIY